MKSNANKNNSVQRCGFIDKILKPGHKAKKKRKKYHNPQSNFVARCAMPGRSRSGLDDFVDR